MTMPDAPALPNLIERLSGAPDRLTCVDRLQLYATDETSDFDAADAFEVASLLGEAAAEISRLQSALEARTEAAQGVISSRSDTYKARNGRVMGIQDDAGEKMWVVPFDEMFALEAVTPPAAAIRKLQEQS